VRSLSRGDTGKYSFQLARYRSNRTEHISEGMADGLIGWPAQLNGLA